MMATSLDLAAQIGDCTPISTTREKLSDANAPASKPTAAAPNGAVSSQKRKLVFPPKSIGLLLVVNKTKNLENAKQIGGAQGTVELTVPSDQLLIFEINQNGFLHPELLETVTADGIDVLKVSLLSMADGEEIVCDRALGHVSRFSHVQYLILDSSDSSDLGISRLPAAMPNLTTLSAEASQVHGTFVKSLKFPQLKTMNLSSCQLASGALQPLSKYKKLTSIRLAHTNIGPAEIKQVALCKQLQKLDLSDNQKIDDECLKMLAPLSNLEVLGLSRTRVTARGLAQLKCPQLKRLVVSKDRFTTQEFATLESMFPAGTLAYRLEKNRRTEDLNMILAPTEKTRK